MKATAALAAVMLLAALASAETIPGRVRIINDPPQIVSITTYCSYSSLSVNVPCTRFWAPDKRTVYVAVNVSDGNGAADVNRSGSVKVKLVTVASVEGEYKGFGNSFKDGSLVFSGELDTVWIYSYEMSHTDPTRNDTLHYPGLYRAKAEVVDGQYVVVSGLASAENADYSYTGIPKVVINEFMPDFRGIVGFIELYNAGGDPVNLTGWFIGDDNETSSTYNLSGILNPQEYRAYYSNETGVGLEPEGDMVRLVYPGDWWLQSFTYSDGEPIGDIMYSKDVPVSIGLSADGEGSWVVYDDPTPGATNTPESGQGGGGESSLDVSLSHGCAGEPATLKVSDRLRQPLGGARVAVAYDSLTVFRGWSDINGSASFTPKEAGEYSVGVSKGGYESWYGLMDIPECGNASAAVTTTQTTQTTQPTSYTVESLPTTTQPGGKREQKEATSTKSYMDYISNSVSILYKLPVIKWTNIYYIGALVSAALALTYVFLNIIRKSRL